MNHLPFEPNYHLSMDVLDLNHLYQGWRKEIISTDDITHDMQCFHYEEPPKISLPCCREGELVSISIYDYNAALRLHYASESV